MKPLFLLFMAVLINAACQSKKKSIYMKPETVDYHEAFRSQYHFTPPFGWMNDPNGMVYFEGEYHLFYQHYPDSTVWGPMHWGHAVSKDLIHWEHLPIALFPDKLGYIFSGSAVVDVKNTSGFGSAGSPPLVAIFTYHDMSGEKAGRTDFQTQGIAYSLDKGRTWTKYDQNPVLTNPGIRDFRDPKVAWNEKSNQWVMTLAVKDHVEFYGSADLKKWKKLSEFGKENGNHGGVWECPDLFSIKDVNGNEKWALLVSINPGGPQGGSATQYFIGEFDGQKFSPQDSLTRWVDQGADNYAGVTFSDIPTNDGRRLFLGWMSNWQYANVVPTKTWRSAFTLPREISINKNAFAYELKFKPAAEISKILSQPKSYLESAKLESPLCMIEIPMEGSGDLTFTLSNRHNERVIISFINNTLAFDRKAAGLSNFNPFFGAVHPIDIKGVAIKKINIYIDLASVEVFINDGERVITEIIFPTEPYDNVYLSKKNPQFSVSSVSPIWD